MKPSGNASRDAGEWVIDASLAILDTDLGRSSPGPSLDGGRSRDQTLLGPGLRYPLRCTSDNPDGHGHGRDPSSRHCKDYATGDFRDDYRSHSHERDRN